VAKELEQREQRLRDEIKAAEEGTRNGAPVNMVTPEQRARSRMRAERVRLKREYEILDHAVAYVARDTL
jgi:transposase-like protein